MKRSRLKRGKPLQRSAGGLKRSGGLSRGEPLKRGNSLERRTRINPINRDRRNARRECDFGDLAEHVRTLPCLVCGRSPVDPAHVRSRGAGGHAWIEGSLDVHGVPFPIRVGNIVPLCRAHHTEQHASGIRTFERAHRLDLAAEAERIGREFAGGA